MKILIVEDNLKTGETLLKELVECEFDVALALNGTETRSFMSQKTWDIILLSIMLPEMNGYELLQYIRFKNNFTPIIILSSSYNADEKIKSLSYGADDYLASPFDVIELVAHIHSLVRRSKLNYEESKIRLECDDLKLYTDQRLVLKGDQEIKLTSQEFKLLKLLMENKDTLLLRSQILDTIWGKNYEPNSNIIDVCISNLRNKIDPKSPQQRIETVQKHGFILHSHKNK